MNVLIGCEFSGIVREAFRARGHNAVSCDILATEIDGQHYQGDIFEFLEMTDGYWDLGIFHPPCTYLSVSSNKWYKDQPPRESGALVGQERRDAREESIEFFMALYNCNIPKVAIENPIGIMSSRFRKPNQIIQPWMFGHKEKKATCLWTRGLPKLMPISNLKIETDALPEKEQQRMHYMPSSEDRWKLRSLTYYGIAEAFATQWSQPTKEKNGKVQ